MAAAPGKTRGYYVPLAIKTISLIAIYATYGLLQERIIKGHYKNAQDGTSDETFESPPLLVFCNRVVSLATGLVLAQIQPPALSLPTTTSLPLQETWAQKLSAIATRIRPASPFIYYGLIAVLNNAATLSQYGSLSYLSFTTSTLGKSAKMVPVLIIGQLWYGKKYRLRQRVGVVIVILGIWGYLNSLPKAAVGRDGHMTGSTTNWVGVLYLLTYLFFDGMTSTMQERLFGQEKAGQEPFTLMGITGGIIDQMVINPPTLVNAIKLIVHLDMGQPFLIHNCALYDVGQPLRLNAIIYQTGTGYSNPPTAYFAT
jgi:drug/metabolite transporter (DMT)-like permease